MSSDYLPFANESGANVVPQAQWSGYANRRQGFRTGIAPSDAFNKVWRQATVMVAAIAEFIDARIPGNVVDDGNVGALHTQFAQAIGAHAGQTGIGEAPHNGRWFARRNSDWHDTENMPLDGGTWS